mmetsp:Transcript_34479/g.68483  ORF Transcript_34479/g.68483 Transcript_34479/m.68483 type:complete len:89 (-) Transcript_34479:17-283(-)
MDALPELSGGEDGLQNASAPVFVKEVNKVPRLDDLVGSAGGEELPECDLRGLPRVKVPEEGGHEAFELALTKDACLDLFLEGLVQVFS